MVNLIDLFGCQLFQFRDDILEYIRLLATDEQYRSKLGSIKRKLAKLDAEDKEVALAIAENAMNHLIEQVSGMLCDAPTGYEENYSIQYKLECRILLFDSKKYKIVARRQLGDEHGKIAISFGRWLNMFGK